MLNYLLYEILYPLNLLYYVNKTIHLQNTNIPAILNVSKLNYRKSEDNNYNNKEFIRQKSLKE